MRIAGEKKYRVRVTTSVARDKNHFLDGKI